MVQSKEIRRREAEYSDSEHAGSNHKDFENPDSENIEYRDQDTSDRTQTTHPGADQKPSWEEGDKTREFVENLRLINGPLAERIDHRLEIKEGYPNLAKSISEGFNETDFPSRLERHEGAKDLACQLFLHTWKKLNDIPEQNTLERLNRLRDEHSINPSVDPPSGEQLDQISSTTELLYRQNIFAEALFQNEPDSKLGALYNLQMERTLLEPLTYPSHQEENYQEKLFKWLKDNEHTFTNSVAMELADAHLKISWEHALLNPKQYDESTSSQVRNTLNSAVIHQSKKLEDAVSNDDLEAFKKTLDDMPGRDLAIYRALTQNTGFTRAPAEHRTQLPDSFLRLEQAQSFAEEIKKHADVYLDPQHTPNPDIREAIRYELHNIESEIRSQEFIQEEQPDMSDWWFEDYDRLHDIAKTLTYLTRPNDPDFWNMVDHQNGVTEEILIGYAVEAATSAGFDAANETLTDENKVTAELNAHNAMVQAGEMKIRSDVEKEDIASYQAHISEIKARSETFAQAIRTRTGFTEILQPS